MYEFLKKLFGAGENGEPVSMTYEQLEEAIDADKGIKLVNLNDGGYVSQEKFDRKETELKGVTQQLADANEQIKSFEGQDIEGIKGKVTEWEQKYSQDTEALKQQMEEMEKAHQRDLYFANVKLVSNAAKIGLMAEFDKQNFQLKDGVFQGADAWLEQKRKDDPASFVQEEPEKKKEDEQPPAGTPGAQKPTLPVFATATSKGSGVSQEQMNPFSFGFRHVREGAGSQK